MIIMMADSNSSSRGRQAAAHCGAGWRREKHMMNRMVTVTVTVPVTGGDGHGGKGSEFVQFSFSLSYSVAAASD